MQAFSGQDLNSVSVDPLFVSSADLHASAGALVSAGTPVAGIGLDIDGQVRDMANPEMGADEFDFVGMGARMADGDEAQVSEIMEETGKGIAIYPNPATDRLQIVLENPKAGLSAHIRLMSLEGKTVIYQEIQSLPHSKEVVVLDLKAIPRGIYLLYIVLDGITTHSSKVIKE